MLLPSAWGFASSGRIFVRVSPQLAVHRRSSLSPFSHTSARITCFSDTNELPPDNIRPLLDTCARVSGRQRCRLRRQRSATNQYLYPGNCRTAKFQHIDSHMRTKDISKMWILNAHTCSQISTHRPPHKNNTFEIHINTHFRHLPTKCNTLTSTQENTSEAFNTHFRHLLTKIMTLRALPSLPPPPSCPSASPSSWKPPCPPPPPPPFPLAPPLSFLVFLSSGSLQRLSEASMLRVCHMAVCTRIFGE